MNDHTPASLQAMYEELARLMIERDGLMKLMREATAEADLDQLAVLLPGISSVRLDIEEVETNIAIRQRQLAEEAKEQARRAALAQLPRPTLLAPIQNAYGEPFVFESAGRKYFAMTCGVSPECVEVSKDFYHAFIAEFGVKYYRYARAHVDVCMDDEGKRSTPLTLVEAQ